MTAVTDEASRLTQIFNRGHLRSNRSAEQFLEVPQAWTKFYMRPQFIARQVVGLSSVAELKRLTKGALSLLKLELLKSNSRTAPV